MISETVLVEIGQSIVKGAVAIEIHADAIEFTVAIDIDIQLSGPDCGRTIPGIQAVIHALSDVAATPGVPRNQSVAPRARPGINRWRRERATRPTVRPWLPPETAVRDPVAIP